MARAVLLALATCALFAFAQGQSCNFPFSWYNLGTSSFWWAEYTAPEDLLLYQFNASFLSNIIAPEHFQCENSAQYANNEFTYAAMRRLTSPQRFCMEVYRLDQCIMYSQSTAVDRNSAYTNEQCISNLESRVSWDLWVQYPFSLSTPPSLAVNLPQVQGSYQLTYQIGQLTNQCVDDQSSTARFVGNQFIISACHSGNTFERPLRTTLFVVGTATDTQVDPAGLMINPPEGGFMALANSNDPGTLNLFSFYCAKYTMMPGYMQLVFSVETENFARCVSDAKYYDQTVRDNNQFLTFQLRTDECSASPCLNGGTCVQEFQAYTCTCPPGFTGARCDANLNECQSNPCLNQGQCMDGDNEFTCSCPNGFTGDRCEVINACGNNPCQNGATCLNVATAIGGYACICADGYVDRNCDKTDVCVQQNIICENGGTCFSDGTDFICKCTPEFSGVYCESRTTAPEPCNPWPCLNGGTCLPNGSQNTYSCICPTGYFGTNCESTMPVTDPPGTCDGQQIVCENGGRCYTNGNEYMCECVGYWDGPYCAEWTDWFIAAIVMAALLLLIFLILLILCVCYCCCGWRTGGRDDVASVYSETRTLDAVSNAPSTVQFNLSPPSPYYGIKVMDR